METERLLNLACEMGRQLLQNGAEIYRVEESIQHILHSYGRERIEVFAIPSCIIINIQDADRNHTKAVRIKTASNNLRKLGQLNALCREICAAPPPVEQAQTALRAVVEEPVYPQTLSYLAYGMAAFFFTLFYGGNLRSAAVAFACGLTVKATVFYMKRLGANVFFTNLLAGALLAMVPLGLLRAGMALQLDKVIIGAIMLLVPGIAITNVMRDVLSGDFLTALTRFAEVLIVAMGIAVGVAISITAGRLLAGWL